MSSYKKAIDQRVGFNQHFLHLGFDCTRMCYFSSNDWARVQKKTELNIYLYVKNKNELKRRRRSSKKGKLKVFFHMSNNNNNTDRTKKSSRSACLCVDSCFFYPF